VTEAILAAHARGVPWLTLAWALPIAGALAVSRVRDQRLAGDLAVGAIALMGGLVAALGWTWHEAGEHGFVLEQRLRLGPLGYHVGLDGVGAVFALVACLLALLVAAYGRRASKPRAPTWQAWGLLLLASLLGMLTSLDLLQFAAFGLLEIVPAVALVRGWGTGEARDEAASTFRRFFLGSAALWIAGAVVLASQAGSFDVIDLLAVDVAHPYDAVAFVLLLYALAVRLPLFPFHAWLPPVIAEGPVVGLNVFLLGLKVGVFGLVRFVLPVLPDVAASWAWLVTGLGLLGMVYGALVAFVQPDVRRMVAYAALSHMGFVVPGVFSLSTHGVEGALLEAVNLGVASAGLYVVIGFLHLRTGTSELVRLRGLATGVPLLSLTLLVVILTSIGMPGTTGFDGLHLVVEGAIDHGDWQVALFTASGTVLAAGVLLVLYQRLVFAPRAADGPRLPDLSPAEAAIAFGLVASVFGMGLWADPWIDAMHDAAELATRREAHDEGDHDATTDPHAAPTGAHGDEEARLLPSEAR
jgi:NADH-quinone oxidoreductase subunit M